MEKLRNTLTVLAFVLVLTGCASGAKLAPNPLTTAQRPETVALALYGSYTIAEEVAGAVATDLGTPPDVKFAIQSADALASPQVEKLPPLAQIVSAMRADAKTIASPGDATKAIDDLNAQITLAAPLIKSFADAYKNSKAPAPSKSTTSATGSIGQ